MVDMTHSWKKENDLIAEFLPFNPSTMLYLISVMNMALPPDLCNPIAVSSQALHF